MRISITVLLALLMLNSASIKAQYLKGNQNLLDGPSGKVLLQLKDSTRLFAYPEIDSWIRLSGVFLVETALLNTEDSLLGAGVELFCMNLNVQGNTAAEIKVLEWQTVKGKKFKNYRQARVEGWVFHNRLHRDDVPQFVIRDLIEKSRGNLSEALFDWTERFRLDKREFEDYTAWVFRAHRGELHPQPDFQYIVVERGGIPFCVIAKYAPMEFTKEKHRVSERDIHYTYLQKPNPKSLELMRDIAYAFVRL